VVSISTGELIVNRRRFFAGLLAIALAGATATANQAEAQSLLEFNRKRKRRKAAKPESLFASPKIKPYAGRKVVSFASPEKSGTIIIKTHERALYQVLGNGKARRYLVAVGKEGFSWSGVARVGMKKVNPRWTPPPEMIERTPRYAKWAGGMPGGIPENPLGVRALYLFTRRGDTGFRIHGTNAPSSIGTAASSGCIRMLNREVIELYNNTPRGTKVIVI
jgi:lipoprotein-anchoring transpeptidase ErfK/SrfK